MDSSNMESTSGSSFAQVERMPSGNLGWSTLIDGGKKLPLAARHPETGSPINSLRLESLSQSRNVTWAMGFAAGDRLRYAHLSTMMSTICHKMWYRWNFVAWQSYASEASERHNRNNRGRRASVITITSSLSSSRAASASGQRDDTGRIPSWDKTGADGMASSLTSLASMGSLARSPMGARLESGTLNSTSASMGGGMSRAPSGPSGPSGGISRKPSAGTPSGIQRVASTESNSMMYRAMHSNDDDEMHHVIYDFEGYGVQVHEAPMPYSAHVEPTRKYTGGDNHKMSGIIRVVKIDGDQMWHLSFKETGRAPVDIGAIFMVKYLSGRHQGGGDNGNPGPKKISVAMGLKEADGNRWKWTFEGIVPESECAQELESLREVLAVAMDDNSAMMRFAERLTMPASAGKVFLTYDMAVVRVQRMWRKVKGRKRPGWNSQDGRTQQNMLRARGAIAMQKVVRSHFAKKALAERKEQRELECLSAVKLGNLDWMTLLVTRKGVKINFQDSKGRTPLHHAAETNQEMIVSRLVQIGADIEARDHRGNTPLHVACAKRASGAARRLAFCGADIEARNDQGWTPVTRPHLFLMPLLEGLSRHLMRKEGRLSTLYQEPSFLSSRPPEVRVARYATGPIPMTGVQTRLDLSMVATPRSMHVTPRDMVATPRSMHVTPRDMVATPRSMQVTPRDMVSTSRVPSASVERQREHQGSLYTDLPQPVPRSPVRMPVLQDPLRNAMASTLATDGSKFPELMHPALRKREKLLMISPSKPRDLDMLSTPWASGQKSKMTWSVPMRSMTGRTAPGPVIVRT